MAIFITIDLINHQKINKKSLSFVHFNKTLIDMVFYNQNDTRAFEMRKNTGLFGKKKNFLKILNFILSYKFSKKKKHAFFFSKIKIDKLFFLYGLSFKMIFFLVDSFKFLTYVNLVIMSNLLHYKLENNWKVLNCYHFYTWIISKKYFTIFKKIVNNRYFMFGNFLFSYNIKFLLKTKILYIIGNNMTLNYFIWEFLIFFQATNINFLFLLYDLFFFNALKKKFDFVKILQTIKFISVLAFEISFFE
nr:hypothetical protein CparaKRNrm2_p027 [Cryptomonas paramecium]